MSIALKALGHNLGSLLTALDNLSMRPLDAINLIRNMLKVDINIILMTEYSCDLIALTGNGYWVTRETSIDEMPDNLVRLEPSPEVT